MYESPIEKIYGEIQSQIKRDEENLVYKVNQLISYKIDKEELVKALQYDRNQYQKGYTDGRNEVLDKIRAEIEKQEKWLLQIGCNTYNVDIALDAIKSILTDFGGET